MRTFFIIFAILMLSAGFAAAQGFGPGDGTCNFIDEDGDGYNDLAPDADGDGIPNGLDPDYVKPEDGTGSQMKHQYGKASDELAKSFGAAMGAARGALLMNQAKYANAYAGEGAGFAYGPGDGTGTGVGPGDGTGFGPGDGTGDCDGTGSSAASITTRRGGRR
ncbi:MAG TPA: hypothetical protein PLQ13_00440 [Candidatus Krumholzibacteria bacterium]|nr:hypothetical protein [Candidatus Krumholzibacteria bacterium]